LKESELWAYGQVEKTNGRAFRVEITNGNVIIPFTSHDGQIVRGERRPFPGIRTSCDDDLFLPRGLYNAFFKKAVGILREKRKPKE
jgi:hypothetical protein